MNYDLKVLLNNKKTMTTEKDLQGVVRDRLRIDGYLNKLQSEVRTKVLGALRVHLKGTAVDVPAQPLLLAVINSLITEYLQWMAYTYTNTVFITESNSFQDHSSETLGRLQLTEYLGVVENEKSRSLPLLLMILTTYEQEHKQK